MYMCNGTKESCRRTADMIELLQVEMQHNVKGFRAIWNTQLNQDNLREDKVMVHKMHQVFVGTLKKSGMHNVSRLDTNHILKEIGINPDKNAGIEWTHLQKLLRVWRRPYSPEMPADEQLLLRLEEEGPEAGHPLNPRANKGNAKRDSILFLRRKAKSPPQKPHSTQAPNECNMATYQNLGFKETRQPGVSTLKSIWRVLFRCSSSKTKCDYVATGLNEEPADVISWDEYKLTHAGEEERERFLAQFQAKRRPSGKNRQSKTRVNSSAGSTPMKPLKLHNNKTAKQKATASEAVVKKKPIKKRANQQPTKRPKQPRTATKTRA